MTAFAAIVLTAVLILTLALTAAGGQHGTPQPAPLAQVSAAP